MQSATFCIFNLQLFAKSSCKKHTLKKIRDINPYVSIIILTVDERQEIADDFLKHGATDFAIKPIKAPDLIARIQINLKIGQIQTEKALAEQNMFVDKGISSTTLDLIEKALLEMPEAFTIDDLSKSVGLAYQTVHRYVQFLLEKNKIEVVPVYGALGRPKNKYRLLIREKS
jgi:two-component system response regulator DctR